MKVRLSVTTRHAQTRINNGLCVHFRGTIDP